MAEYNIHIEGYWSDENRSGLPDKHGIYFVYRGVPNGNTSADMKELIYIGKADDETFKERHYKKEHERHQDFLNCCASGEKVYYAYAEVENRNINAIENAFIYVEKPRLNKELKYDYKYGDITIQTTGYNTCMEHTYFLISKGNIADIEEVDM